MQNIFRWFLLLSFFLSLFVWVFYQPETPQYFVKIQPSNIKPIEFPAVTNKNEQIQTFQADLNIVLSYRFFKISATATLFMEKPKNFRLLVYKNDKEMDLGSNDVCFWYWTKKNKTVFFGNYSDYPNIDLKATLNPVWIMESLGLHKIENFESFQTEKYIIYSQTIKINNENIKRIIFVQKDINAIIGSYVLDEKETIISSIEIIEFYESKDFFIPKTILILYPEENINMEWRFENIKLNGPMDKNLWNKPYSEFETNLKY